MTTNENDLRNQQTDTRSKDQTKDGILKKETPKNPATNLDTQTDQRTQGKQNETGSQKQQGSTSSQTRTNTEFQDSVRREVERTEKNSVKRNPEDFKTENKNTQNKI